MEKIYDIIEPPEFSSPILVSVPHRGTEFPDDLISNFNEEPIKHLDDTDWYVDKLYSFCFDLGIPMIRARFHRWVVDLNRGQDNIPLYADGRALTDLIPMTAFGGETLYIHGKEPNPKERKERIQRFYTPYHNRIAEFLEKLKLKFGKALLFDAHSIRSYVPAIHPDPFPDLILGDNNGLAADPGLSSSAQEVLEGSHFSFRHNEPFRGGHITRSFGDPSNCIHAIQMEMSKQLYMNDDQNQWDDERASLIQGTLKVMFSALISKLEDI